MINKYHQVAQLNSFMQGHALLESCAIHDIEMMIFLLKVCKVNVDFRDDKSNSCLSISCQKGYLDIIELIFNDPKLNDKLFLDENYVGLLDIAIENDRDEVVNYLITSPIFMRKNNLVNIFQNACLNQQEKLVNYFITEEKIILDEDLQDFFFCNTGCWWADELFERKKLKESLENTLIVNQSVNKKNKI